jgi:hypothetical protein
MNNIAPYQPERASEVIRRSQSFDRILFEIKVISVEAQLFPRFASDSEIHKRGYNYFFKMKKKILM